MLNRTLKLLVGACALLVFAGVAIGAAAEKEKADGVAKTNVIDQVRAFTINNIFNYYGNNGVGSYNVYTGNGGLEFPKGSVKTAIYEDGVVWGGFHMGRPNPKVGGSVYRHALQAGRITTPGTTVPAGTYSPNTVNDDPTLAIHRVYRVRPDVRPGVAFADVEEILNAEAELISRDAPTTAQALYNEYLLDWNEWPAKTAANPIGLAPFQDKNANGTYEPGADVPGIPGADQSMYYLANDNNNTITQNLAGCPPIGVEVHRTFWGYNRSNYLGNMIFSSTLVINKSGYSLDSAFFVQWSDPDLGDSGDDYAGCDIDRSLGYIYNGKPYDGTYGTAVPAAGYDFFQGPIVPGTPTDRAVFQLQYRDGYKNLGMSAFVFFTQGNALYADPAQGSNGDIQWYRLMNGRVASNGQAFTDPTTGLESKFTLSGDPVSGTGWLDGTGGLTPQDRRICLVTGPFTLANADTQELVVATLVGLGGDRISSVAVLKWYSDLAQSVYDNLFNIPSPPAAPVVGVAALDAQVSLNWGDPAVFEPIEATNSVGYAFEGYNVYQLPGVNFDRTTAKRLATYDIVNSITTVFDDEFDAATGYVLQKPVHFGSDSGLKRSYVATTDALNSRPLYNGSPYYFAVTAYSVNSTAKPTQLESSPRVVTVYPQVATPGVRYAPLGDTLAVTQTVAPGGSASEGEVIPIVVDPTKTTGHQYSVSFGTDTVTGNTFWRLRDVTAGRYVYTSENQGGDEDYPIVDGILVKVTGPSTPGMKDWSVGSTGVRHITWVDGTGFGLEGFEATIGNAYDHWFMGGVGYDKHKNVEIRFATADGTWDPRADQSASANFSKAYRYVRGATAAPAVPSFAPWIVNAVAGYAFQEFNWSVPFAAYDIEANPPRRLAVGHLENNTALGLIDGRYWPRVNGTYPSGTTNVGATGPREWFFIYDKEYSTTQDPELAVDILNVETPMMWMGTVSRRSSAPNFVNTSTFTIWAAHINTANNTFTFTAPPAVAIDQALAAEDVEKINVFPNPYIGFNNLEANKYERFVRFTHLPQNATIRVFNLAGVLIRTMQKTGGGQFYDWDLRNESGFPAGAGMYVIHIDMPDLGKTKILKLGLIPEQQFIDRW